MVLATQEEEEEECHMDDNTDTKLTLTSPLLEETAGATTNVLDEDGAGCHGLK